MPKNRKARVMTAERKLLTKKEVSEKGSMCAWDGCSATFEGLMPPDWRHLLVYWSPRPSDSTLVQVSNSGFCDRDAVLCPEHWRELDGRLKDLARWMGEPTAGEA